MRKTRSLTPALAAALILVMVGILTAIVPYATLAKGPNDPATECLVQLQGNDENPLSGPVQCTDGAACDSDGATNDSCTIGVRACLNVPGCTPLAIRSAKVTPRPTGISVTPNGTSSVCGAFTDRIVLKLKKRGQKPSRKRNITAKVKSETKGQIDVDKAKVQCIPCPTESCVPTTTTTVVQVTTTSTSSSTTTTTLACGNGVIDAGEACDPDATPNNCAGGTPFCSTDCTACQANCTSLLFKIGTPSPGCGFPGQQDPAQPPFTGEIQDGTATKVTAGDLAAGCLYIGGGLASIVPPGPTPENGETIIDIADCSVNNVTLAPSEGRGSDRSCSVGPKTTKRCLNGHPGTDGQGLCTSDAQCAPLCVNRVCEGGPTPNAACTADGDCGTGGVCRGNCVNGPGNLAGGKCDLDSGCGLGVTAQTCQPEANCLFGAPLPFVNDPTSTCVINVIQDGVGGTADVAAGTAAINMPLQSRVYLTGITYGLETPCPKCESSVCSGGKRAGQACVTDNSLLTTHDCPPDDNLFLAPLNVNLSPLTTGQASDTTGDGIFCGEVGQDDNPPGSAGAFGVGAARTIIENGSPAPGPLSVTAQDMTLGSTFCIPSADGGGLIDSAANLPGPGATALSGTTRLR